MLKKTLFLFSFLFSLSAFAQKSTIRGNVFDDKGTPIGFADVFLVGTSKAANTDLDGFFNIADVSKGKYRLVARLIGYDSTFVDIEIKSAGIVYQRITMKESSGVELTEVKVTAQKKEIAKSEVQVSKVTITPKQIRSLPSTGGDADIAQYLPVLPGVIFTGDQGGQLYIRGGSPVQNKILLDGMTIYNPFHSIGFYSVFETETIRSVDVYTGGFGAEYGGRISAVVDIKTREGNKKNFGGTVAISPFQTKALIEGPIIKLDENNGGASLSYLFTAKKSLIDKTSRSLYNYAAQDTASGLPFSFTDLYGKVSLVAANGSKVNFFGFNFDDAVKYQNIAEVGWNAKGGGANFTLIPALSNLIINGKVTFSNYQAQINDADKKPRESGISGYNALLDFTYYGNNNEVKYGIELNGFQTNFQFTNFANYTYKQDDNNTEIAGFLKYKQKAGSFVLEPSVRFQYYASLNNFQVEPRMGLKWNIANRLRFKAAGGYYTQNLLSTVNERDIVNLFVGFLAGPERINELNTNKTVTNRLQKAYHAIAGFEIDVNDNWDLNVEPYYKNFIQLIGINRNKTTAETADFNTETGKAYGIDFSSKYQNKNTYLWFTYSYGFVNRFDGIQTYPTIFDRRHNINALVTYNFGKDNSWEASLRWNMGSGFPFTQTQAFYDNQSLNDGITADPLTGNGQIGIIYSDTRNGGRLPYYHRLDGSVKKTMKFGKRSKLEIVASCTNMYNRKNIFYFDRVRYTRVNQLPTLPTLSANFSF
jgi:outer membrane receptor protein involved in Fe transport